MKIKIKYMVKAILSGVDETVIGNLNFGNSYIIVKDSLTNHFLWEEFDYTAFGIRRIYELSKLNDNLEIALLTKNIDVTYDVSEVINNGKKLLNIDEAYNCISDFENKELEYIDVTMRYIRLFSENCFNIKELLIRSKIETLDDNIELIENINSKIPLPDKITGNIAKLHIENKIEAENLNNFIRKTEAEISSLNFSPDLLKQACFLYDQSYTSPVDTMKFMACVIGMESILVDGKSELSYRFSRNGAMLLSNDAEEYWKFSKMLKEIYNKRSTYVHTGNLKKLNSDDIIQARQILRKIILKVLSKNISKDELLKELEVKGF